MTRLNIKRGHGKRGKRKKKTFPRNHIIKIDDAKVYTSGVQKSVREEEERRLGERRNRM